MEKILYEGLAVGGPVDGQQLISRCPKGLLMVDKPNGICWIYDWKPQDPVASVFVAREPEGRPLDTKGRLRAADEPDYDVVALP